MTSARATTIGHGANVHANGIRQHYLHYGFAGPTLVLIPGITSPAITWGFVAERLAEHFDVYVLDVRGRGLSSTGPELNYELDALANDLTAFVEALDLTDVTVVGHSMGARIAIRAAARDDGRLAQLVLVDPPVSGPGRRPYPAKWAWYGESIRQATVGMTAEDMRAYCPTWSVEQRALRAEWLHTCYEPAIVTAFSGFHTDDIHKDLPNLKIPAALMIAGVGDVILPVDAAEITALNPSIRITRVEGAGHMIPFEDFDGFFAAIDRLIGTNFTQAVA